MGLCEANKPQEERYEYGKYIFDSGTKCNTENNQKGNNNIEVDCVKHQFDAKHVDDLLLHDTSVNPKHHDPPKCELDPTEVKQLQGQDIYLSKIIAKCKSQHHHDKTPHHLDEHGVMYRGAWEESNVSHAIMVPCKMQPYILYESHNALGHISFTWLYKFIKRFYYWKKLCQDCNKYIRSCTDCQQVTL